MTGKRELLPGTVDLLVLRALSFGSAHGYQIARLIHTRSGDVLTLEGPALYQALQRLERAGLIDAEWGVSENNRRARYYTLTATGRRSLRAERKGWQEYVEAIGRVLSTAE